MHHSALIQVRVDAELHRRLTQLRTKHHVNLSAWLRALIARELDRELGPERRPCVWRPLRLADGSWGAIFRGDPAELSAKLVGTRITVQPKRGPAWRTRVREVVEHQPDRVIVSTPSMETHGRTSSRLTEALLEKLENEEPQGA